ncbi:MAG TPA: MlaD family protein [Verrucomicrobiae bacterium]|nr:MlaD family protein [Verrucomicrobiae bacterium]
MALQDLTPQLRTRLSRMERAVGWFVLFAFVLLVLGFGYYVYTTAQRKGWFLTKITYQTSISSGAGLKIGDPVKLMGFDVGEITEIIPNDPYAPYNITVRFRIKKPNYGYIWSDSTVKVAGGDLLGNRYLEVTKGIGGVPAVHETTNKVADGILIQHYYNERKKELSASFTNHMALLRALNEDARKNVSLYYTNLGSRPFWLHPEESAAVTERLEKLVGQAEAALPNILSLTNQLAEVLSNSARLTANLSEVAANARPAASNLALATAHLDQPGALGEWLLPTNINQKLNSVLGGADSTLTVANTNLAMLASNLNQTLEHLSDITSNLNYQVQMNTNVLGRISKTVMDADDFVQGLKHHWLLRSAFKSEQTNSPPRAPVQPLKSPRAKGAR